MAISFGNSIDLGKNEILNARMQNLSASPTSPLDGFFYYDTLTKTAQLYTADGWVTMGHLGEIFTTVLLTKLNGIAAGANNYTHPSYTAKASGLYKVTVDALGHVSASTAVAKADITALGIPSQDTTYGVATTSANGLMSSTDKVKVDASYTSAQTDTAISTAITALIASSPDVLNTLNELAAALGDDPNFAATMTNALANKVDKITGKQLSTEDFTTVLLTKLNGIAPGANLYTHPTGDGNSHVPATGTTNANKVLKSGSAANSAAWGYVAFSELTGVPTNIAKKAVGTVGNGTATSFVLTHDLGTQDVIISFRETASPYSVVITDASATSASTITVNFASPPTANQYTVTVVG